MPRVSAGEKLENRRRLLEAGAEEFAARGLDGANINSISLAAGLAKGTVYNHFASKEELFLAVVQEACELAVAGSRSAVHGATTRERLWAAVASDVDWARGHAPFARVLVREVLSADPRFYPRVLEAAAPFISRVSEILADGVARGDVRADIPVEQLALVCIGLIDLALVSHWGSGGAWPGLDDIPELVTGVFLDGAAPRTSGGGAA